MKSSIGQDLKKKISAKTYNDSKEWFDVCMASIFGSVGSAAPLNKSECVKIMQHAHNMDQKHREIVLRYLSTMALLDLDYKDRFDMSEHVTVFKKSMKLIESMVDAYKVQGRKNLKPTIETLIALHNMAAKQMKKIKELEEECRLLRLQTRG